MATDTTTKATNTNRPGDANDASVPGSTTSENLLKGNSLPQYPSEQTDINSILEPYVNQLMQLGPEYQKEMNYLAPYLSGQVTDNQLAPTPAYTGPDASTVNEGQSSLMQADNALGTAVEDQDAPGFGQETSAAKQYENTILPSAGIQSGLAYQKYLETYGGMQADQANWTQEQKDAYAAIVGDTSSTGLPSVTDESAANNATNTANQVQEQITSSANASTADGGNIQ
jgi:hypothetical protein